MTTSETELHAISGVWLDVMVNSFACEATCDSVRRVAVSQSPNSCRVFLRIKAGTSRLGGV